MAGRIELQLGADGDLLFDSSGSLVISDNLAQRLATRLRLLLGEWFLDLSDGTPYLQTILVKSPDLGRIKAAFRDRILATEGVARVDSIDLSLNKTTRVLSVSFRARAETGALIALSNVPLGVPV